MMKSRLIGAVAVCSAVTLIAVFTAVPAYADDAGTSPTVEFGVLEDASYVDVYDAILDVNGSETAAAFFSEAEAQTDAVDLPGLDALSDDQKGDVLAASAEAAAQGAPLPLTDLPPEVSSGDTQSAADSAVVSSASRPVISTAFATKTKKDAPVTERASFSSAPIAGNAINNRRSWQMSNRYNWSECSIFSCSITSWIDFRFTTDPGKSTSRTSLNFNKWGTKIGNVQVNSWIFAAGNNYGASGWKTWNTPGFGTQWNYHNSTLNKSFQAWYEVKIGRPGGTQSFEFKTGKTATCKEPSPAAYQCVF